MYFQFVRSEETHTENMFRKTAGAGDRTRVQERGIEKRYMLRFVLVPLTPLVHSQPVGIAVRLTSMRSLRTEDRVSELG